MKKLYIILALLIASPCFGQLPYPIQTVHNLTTAGTGFTCTYNNNVKTGSLLIIAVGWNGAGNVVSSVTDSLGTPTIFSQSVLSTATAIKVMVYAGITTTSGADTITAAIPTSGDVVVGSCLEINPGGITSTADGTPVVTAYSSSSNITTGTYTTTVNGDLLIFGNLTLNQNHTASISKPDLEISNGDPFSRNLSTSYRIAGVAGSYTSNVILSTADSGSVFLVGYQPSTTKIVSPTALPDAVEGASYSYTLTAQGGSGAYTWSVTSGALPLGLSLNTSTGTISGTATNSTAGSITFGVTDGTLSTSQVSTLHVGTAASTPAFVHSASSGIFSGGSTSGNTIIVTQAFNEYAGCSDSLGTVYIPIAYTTTFGSGASDGNVISVGKVTATGANTITCLVNLENATEFSGIYDVGYADGALYNTGTDTSTLATPALTPYSANSLIYALWSFVGTGYTGASTSPCTALTLGALRTGTCYEIGTTITGYTETYTSTADLGSFSSSGIFSVRPTSTGTAPLPSGNHPRVIGPY